MFGGATKEYRYRLCRTWDETKPHAMFVMMNPSTATLWSTIQPSRSADGMPELGATAVCTWATPSPTAKKRLRLLADPVGPDNDKHLIAMAKEAALVVFAYGQPGHPRLTPRGIEVARLLRSEGVTPYVLALSKAGVPMHPLYLRGSLKPVLWPVQ